MGCIEVDVDSLIELVKMYPHLYDVKNKHYKNNAAKDGSWEEISAALSVTIDDCKRLWKNLRDRFTKERRSLTMGPDGPTSDWPHYKRMLFYSQYLIPKRTVAPLKRHADVENSRGRRRYRSFRLVAPKQIAEDTETSCSSGNFPENDPDGGESETSWRENRRFGEPERRLPPSDDVGAFRPATVERIANVNDAFALYLSNRLNEMTPEEARDKRKLIISVIEDLKY